MEATRAVGWVVGTEPPECEIVFKALSHPGGLSRDFPPGPSEVARRSRDSAEFWWLRSTREGRREKRSPPCCRGVLVVLIELGDADVGVRKASHQLEMPAKGAHVLRELAEKYVVATFEL